MNRNLEEKAQKENWLLNLDQAETDTSDDDSIDSARDHNRVSTTQAVWTRRWADSEQDRTSNAETDPDPDSEDATGKKKKKKKKKRTEGKSAGGNVTDPSEAEAGKDDEPAQKKSNKKTKKGNYEEQDDIEPVQAQRKKSRTISVSDDDLGLTKSKRRRRRKSMAVEPDLEDIAEESEGGKSKKKKRRKRKDSEAGEEPPSSDEAEDKETEGSEPSKKQKRKKKKNTEVGEESTTEAIDSEGAAGRDVKKKKKKKKKPLSEEEGETEVEDQDLDDNGKKKKKKRRQSVKEKVAEEEVPVEENQPPFLKFMKRAKLGLEGETSEWNRPPIDIPPPLIMGRLEDVSKVLQNTEGYTDLPTPYWSRPRAEAAPFMILDNGAPYNFPVAPNLKGMDENVMGGVLAQFSTMPIERVHHFALNGEFLCALYRNRQLVDLLIHVEDKHFYAHRSVLSAHSGYFASILIDNDIPPYMVTDVTLMAIEPNLFKMFIHFAYTGDIDISLNRVQALKRLAQMLKSSTLKAKIMIFMSKMNLISLDDALEILVNHIESEEKPIAVEVVKKNFKIILDDLRNMCHFTLEDFLDIISSNNLCVNSELDVFWAVLFWVASDVGNRINFLNRLMAEVRFTRMSSLELLDCARVSELVRLSKKCKKMLITSNWVCHARELGLEDPLGLPEHQRRYCLDGEPPYTPTVAEFDKRFLIYKSLMGQEEECLGFAIDKDRDLQVSYLDAKDVSTKSPTKDTEETEAQPARKKKKKKNKNQDEEKGDRISLDVGLEGSEPAPIESQGSEEAVARSGKEKKKKKKKKKSTTRLQDLEQDTNENKIKPHVGSDKERQSTDTNVNKPAQSRLLERMWNVLNTFPISGRKTGCRMSTSTTMTEEPSEGIACGSPSNGLKTNALKNDSFEIKYPTNDSASTTNSSIMSNLDRDVNKCSHEEFRSTDFSWPEAVHSSQIEGMLLSSHDTESKGNDLCGYKSVNPIQLWECNTPNSREVCLLGGDILQPLRTNKIHLNRTRITDEPQKSEVDGNNKYKMTQAGRISEAQKKVNSRSSNAYTTNIAFNSLSQQGGIGQTKDSHQSATQVSSSSRSVVYHFRNNELETVSDTETSMSLTFSSHSNSSQRTFDGHNDLMVFDKDTENSSLTEDLCKVP